MSTVGCDRRGGLTRGVREARLSPFPTFVCGMDPRADPTLPNCLRDVVGTKIAQVMPGLAEVVARSPRPAGMRVDLHRPDIGGGMPSS